LSGSSPDFVALLADVIDAAAINGSGSSNQLPGILNPSGIGSVVGATTVDGAAVGNAAQRD